MNRSLITGELGIERIRLEMQKFMAQQGIDPGIAANGELKIVEREIGRMLVVQFQRAVASRKYCVKTARYPKNWIEAIKERWFPKWARRRWPVAYEEVTLDANAYYPDIQIPNHQTFVEVMMSARLNEQHNQYQ